MDKKDFILASSSPQRLMLLEQIGLPPKEICPADIDESEKKGEKASAYVKRMALEKARKIAEKHPGAVVLGADTVVVVGAKILHKCHTDEEQTAVMKLLSGKAHRVLSAVCVIGADGRAAVRLNTTRILMKKLSEYFFDKKNPISRGSPIFFAAGSGILIGQRKEALRLLFLRSRTAREGRKALFFCRKRCKCAAEKKR